MTDHHLNAKVSRLRQIIAEAVPVQPEGSEVEADAWRRYQHFAANEPLPAYDTSEFARKVRNINRIACSYGWIGELQRILDTHHASSIQALTDAQLDAMHTRFVTLERCRLDGFDPPDTPHAQ